MSNSNQPNQTNKQWWQINLVLWALVVLIFLYFILPTNNNLIKEIVVGGLIFSSISFLLISVPKAATSSLKRVMSQLANSLTAEIKTQFENSLQKVKQEREEQSRMIIESVSESVFGGKTVQELIKNTNSVGHDDLDFYRLVGLKGDRSNEKDDDPFIFHSPVFQDFTIRGGNINAVSFFWADTSKNPPSKISARLDRQANFLTVLFESHSTGGTNIAIRPSNDIARLKEDKYRYLAFDMQLRKEDEDDSENVEVSFRVVNGWLQHWLYSRKSSKEGFIKAKLNRGNASTWQTFYLDLETSNLWQLFDSDGNYKYGPVKAKFDVITSVIFEFGCGVQQELGGIEDKPGPGKSKVDIRNIRFTQETRNGILLDDR